MVDSERFSRNEALFGGDGQARIRETSVLTVGVGGLGSHVCQQLAYIGVLLHGLIDFDIVTDSSLNRLVGATPEDAERKETKVAVAKRTIRDINPQARVTSVNGKLGDAEAQALLLSADIVFGCVDRDIHRLAITELCAERGKPYFDLATDVGEDGGNVWYGGRVVYSNGQGCLVCLEELDQKSLVLDQMSPEEREVDKRIYGVDRALLEETGPSVVSLNGVVASLAVTEFMVAVTGLREPARKLTYRGDQGIVTRLTGKPVEGCYYCVRHRAAKSRERILQT